MWGWCNVDVYGVMSCDKQKEKYNVFMAPRASPVLEGISLIWLGESIIVLGAGSIVYVVPAYLGQVSDSLREKNGEPRHFAAHRRLDPTPEPKKWRWWFDCFCASKQYVAQGYELCDQ